MGTKENCLYLNSNTRTLDYRDIGAEREDRGLCLLASVTHYGVLCHYSMQKISLWWHDKAVSLVLIYVLFAFKN